MKCRIVTCITAMTLFAALTIPAQLAAPDNQGQHSKHQSYKLIDLGTLGGPTSQVNGTPPPLINNQGTVAGEANIGTFGGTPVRLRFGRTSSSADALRCGSAITFPANWFLLATNKLSSIANAWAGSESGRQFRNNQTEM